MAMMRPFIEMQNQMERLINDLTQPFTPQREELGTRLSGLGEYRWLPPIEMTESDNEVCVRAAIPGVKPEDLDVEVIGNMLTITGETQQETRQEGENVHRSEFHYGRFQRRVQLPAEVKSDVAEANFQHGVLSLTLPKAEVSKRKRIRVNVTQDAEIEPQQMSSGEADSQQQQQAS